MDGMHACPRSPGCLFGQRLQSSANLATVSAVRCRYPCNAHPARSLRRRQVTAEGLVLMSTCMALPSSLVPPEASSTLHPCLPYGPRTGMRVVQKKSVPLRVLPALPMNTSKANLCFRGIGDIQVLHPSNFRPSAVMQPGVTGVLCSAEKAITVTGSWHIAATSIHWLAAQKTAPGPCL